MARTIGELLNDARSHLNDRIAPYRYSDEDLVVYYNDGLRELRRLRPDSFFSLYGTALPEYTVADVALSVIVPDEFFTALAYFVAGNAELRDDEFVVDGRVAGLLKQFVAKAMTSGA